MNKKFFFLIIVILFSIGCNTLAPTAQPSPSPIIFPTWTFSPLPSATAPFVPTQDKPATFTQTLIATDTFTALPSPTFTPTATLTRTPEPQFKIQGPGTILVPILLYHQIGSSQVKDNPYYVSPEEFEKQMRLLYAWGYKTITVQQLANAIYNGAELPIKPIILTFDDGNDNTYTAAFPILQKYNFVGTAYIVYKYIGATGFMSKDQIQALHKAGWEIGSHGLTHNELPKYPERQESEIIGSREKLETLLDFPISTFAYPFGIYDDLSLFHMRDSGYIAAVGLGADMHQGFGNIFYLYRRDIKGSYDLSAFAQFLPWQGDIQNLPIGTTTP